MPQPKIVSLAEYRRVREPVPVSQPAYCWVPVWVMLPVSMPVWRPI